MLFHITAKHDHLTCPRKDPSRRPSVLLSKDLAGVKTVGVWVDGPSHTIYAVLESDSAEAIMPFWSQIQLRQLERPARGLWILGQ